MPYFEHGYAVVIGVGDTQHPALALPVTRNDAQAVHAILMNEQLCGYPAGHIRLLRDGDATAAGILDALAWLQSCAEADPDATTVIYYSGHGWLDTDENAYYLLTHETAPAEADIPDTALSAAHFTKAVQAVPARRLLVIVDSCHAEGMASVKDATAKGVAPDFGELLERNLPKSLVLDLQQGEGRVILTSSRGRQKSWADKEMSIFTRHLIGALQGAANRPGDTVVKWSHLISYIDAAVRTSTGDAQIPFHKAEAENFPIALLGGGKGLPAAEAARTDALPAGADTVIEQMQSSGAYSMQFGHVNELHVHQGPQEKTPDSPTEQDVKRAEEAYLFQLFRSAGPVNLSGIQQGSGEDGATPINLWEVYTALLTERMEQPERLEKIGRATDAETSRHESAVAALNRHQRLVLLGSAGSGKSTFVNFLILCLAGERLKRPEANLDNLRTPLPDDDGNPTDEPQPWEHDAPVPIKIILRDLAAALPLPANCRPSQHLLDFLKHSLEEHGVAASLPGLRHCLERGKALLLFDGLDEVPDTDAPDSARKQIVDILDDCARCFSACRMVVTSRTYAYQHQLPEFAAAVLQPFGDGQIHWFARRWYAHVARVQQNPEQDGKRRAEALQQEIFADPRILDMARRPLLLTMIAALHEWHGTIPTKETELYKKATDLLLRRWEQGKIGETRLSKALGLGPQWPELLHEALRDLAFRAHRDEPLTRPHDTADIAETDLIDRLRNIRPHEDIPAWKLAGYLQKRAGIVIVRGEHYTFPHRSFQEYLAACCLHLSQEELFPDNLAPLICNEPDRWREVFWLAVQMSIPSTRRHIVDLLCRVEPGATPGEPADAWGARFAAEVAVNFIGLSKLTLPDDVQKQDRLRQWLTAIVTEEQPNEPLPALERAQAGNLLAEFGDPRPGVGCRSLRLRSGSESGVEGRSLSGVEGNLPHIEWCDVPEGDFLMGEGDDTLHVHFKEGFQISRYPITNAQFRVFIAAGGYRPDCERYWPEAGWQWREKNDVTEPRWAGGVFDLDNHPVVGVSWYEAMAFCAWLTEALHNAGRMPALPEVICLPSEAEWEYAARGPHSRKYPWEGPDLTPELANYDQTNVNATSAVGCFPQGRSWCGADDMAGNVLEWCLDVWHDNHAGAPADGSPRLKGEDVNKRLLKGGRGSTPRSTCAARTVSGTRATSGSTTGVFAWWRLVGPQYRSEFRNSDCWFLGESRGGLPSGEKFFQNSINVNCYARVTHL